MEQQRKNYQDEAHQVLDDIFKGIESLEGKLRDATKEFGNSMESSIAEMKVDGEKLKNKFEEMRNANNESWDEIRNGFEKIARSLREALTNSWK